MFKCLTLANFKTGAVIIKQGEDGDQVNFFYIIDSGACRVEVAGEGASTKSGYTSSLLIQNTQNSMLIRGAWRTSGRATLPQLFPYSAG